MTLLELIHDLATTTDPKVKQATYRLLARVGMDKMTADILVSEYKKDACLRKEND